MNGGADRNRTCDLLIANETLYQLSYDPIQLKYKDLQMNSNNKTTTFGTPYTYSVTNRKIPRQFPARIPNVRLYRRKLNGPYYGITKAGCKRKERKLKKWIGGLDGRAQTCG